jgi:hypothetical protein
MVEKDNKKSKIKKKLTKEDYISSIVGCFITFFIVTIIIHIGKKEYINNLLFLIGETILPTIIATIITLFSRLPIIGIGIISFFIIVGNFYNIFRDIYNISPGISSIYSILIFVLVTMFGVGTCWIIKKTLAKRQHAKTSKY